LETLAFQTHHSSKGHTPTCCGLLAAIRASSVGSTIYYAVDTLGKHFPLAYGHVALSYTKPTAWLNPFHTHKIPIDQKNKRPRKSPIKTHVENPLTTD
jgi:hypothetical protein